MLSDSDVRRLIPITVNKQAMAPAIDRIPMACIRQILSQVDAGKDPKAIYECLRIRRDVCIMHNDVNHIIRCRDILHGTRRMQIGDYSIVYTRHSIELRRVSGSIENLDLDECMCFIMRRPEDDEACIYIERGMCQMKLPVSYFKMIRPMIRVCLWLRDNNSLWVRRNSLATLKSPLIRELEARYNSFNRSAFCRLLGFIQKYFAISDRDTDDLPSVDREQLHRFAHSVGMRLDIDILLARPAIDISDDVFGNMITFIIYVYSLYSIWNDPGSLHFRGICIRDDYADMWGFGPFNDLDPRLFE